MITLFCPVCEQDACAYSIMVAQWWIKQHNDQHSLGTTA